MGDRKVLERKSVVLQRKPSNLRRAARILLLCDSLRASEEE
jgi:hypothetical protein